MKVPTKLRRKKGFTLFEVVLAMIVIGIVAVPLSLTMVEHVESFTLAKQYGLAPQLARLDMERANNIAYDNLASASFSNIEGYPYDLERTVTYAQGSAYTDESLKKIEVTVRRAGEADGIITLTTYRAKNLTYE